MQPNSRCYPAMNIMHKGTQQVSLSVTVQQCSYEWVFKFYDEVPCSANHSVRLHNKFVSGHEVTTAHSDWYMG